MDWFFLGMSLFVDSVYTDNAVFIDTLPVTPINIH